MTEHDLICEPPGSVCCGNFRAQLFDPNHDDGVAPKRFSQDPLTGIIHDAGIQGALTECPFCGAVVDPVVACGWSDCEERFNLSASWIDNGRHLCPLHGAALKVERERMRGPITKRRGKRS